MKTIWLISDTHFGHANSLKFKIDEAGTLMRPGFRDVSHMDEVMVDNWNKLVKPQDHVYHLGDVAMEKKLIPIVKRLNGHKRLIFGNHDIYEYQHYAQAGFEKMMGMRVMDGMIFTHVPIHPESLGRFKINVHGHLHNRNVMLGKHRDPRYLSVCVEQTGYSPVSLDELKSKIK